MVKITAPVNVLVKVTAVRVVVALALLARIRLVFGQGWQPLAVVEQRQTLLAVGSVRIVVALAFAVDDFLLLFAPNLVIFAPALLQLVGLKVVLDVVKRSTLESVSIAKAVSVQIYLADAVVVEHVQARVDQLDLGFGALDRRAQLGRRS